MKVVTKGRESGPLNPLACGVEIEPSTVIAASEAKQSIRNAARYEWIAALRSQLWPTPYRECPYLTASTQ